MMQHLMTEENKKKGVQGIVSLLLDRELQSGQFLVMNVFLKAFGEASEEEKSTYSEWAKAAFLETHLPHISMDVKRETIEQSVLLILGDLFCLTTADLKPFVPHIVSLFGEAYQEVERLQRMWFMVDWKEESLASRTSLSRFLTDTAESPEKTQEHRLSIAKEYLLQQDAFDVLDAERSGEHRLDETMRRLMSEGLLDEPSADTLRALYRPVITRVRAMRQGMVAMQRDLEIRERFEMFLNRTMNFFPKSYINERNELILDRKENLYIRLEDCRTDKDIKKGLLHFLTRPIAKSLPEKKAEKHLAALNGLLFTSFTREDVYRMYLAIGLATNPELTEAFIRSYYDMSLLETATSVEKG